MSGPDLPDDLGAWPESPHQILGLGWGASQRDIRRAYTQLIKRFKPEQFPEHFRRLREAYETMLAASEYVQRAQADQLPEWEPAPAPSGAASEEAAPGLPRVDPSPDLDRLWRAACDGKEAQVYARLKALHKREPQQQQLLVRLYWLLKAMPELDAKRTACDWLAAGLVANRMIGPAWELYRRELTENSDEARSKRCGRLLATDAEPNRLAQLAVWRWQSAAIDTDATQLLSLILDDVDRLRANVGKADEMSWLRLLIAAISFLAWLDATCGSQSVEPLRREIDALDHLHLHCESELEQLDWLAELVKSWAALSRLPLPASTFYAQFHEELAAAIPISWIGTYWQVRARIDPLLVKLAARPLDCLNWLDQICDPFGICLYQLFRHLVPSDAEPDPRPADELAAIVQAHLSATAGLPLDVWRAKWLNLIQREHLAAEQVRALSATHGPFVLRHGTNLVDQLAADLPLALVCQGIWLFRQ